MDSPASLVRRLTTGQKMLAGLAAASLVLLVGALSYRSSRQAGAAARWVAHTHEVLARLEGLHGALVDVETAQRGFLLTGTPSYLAPLETGRAQAPRELARLRSLTSDNPGQQRALELLTPLVLRRLALADTIVGLAQRGESDSAVRLVRAGEGFRVMDSIRARVAGMRATEEHLLQERIAQRMQRERDAGIVIVGGSIAAFVLIALMMAVIRRDVALQARTAAERDALLVRERAANARLVAIQEVTDATLSATGLDDMLEALMRRLRDTLGVDSACTLLVMRDGVHLEMCKCVGVTADVTDRPTIPLGEGVEGRIAAEASTVRVPDVAAAPVYDPVAREHFASLLGAPLLVRDDPSHHATTGGHTVDSRPGTRVIGVVYVATVRPRAFTAEEERLLALVAERVASAIERARLYQAERRHEARFRLLIESVRDYALVMLDTGGHVASWNTGAERLFGFTAAEILGEPVSRLYAGEDAAERSTEFLARARADGSATAEGWRVRADGSRFWADVTYTVLLDEDDGSFVGYTKVTRDLTERRRIEEALVAAKEEAEAASAAKSQFLATMSHEIRTPINAVLGYTQLLELGVTGPVTDQQREQLHRVEASARHLLGLVNELLDLAKIEADQLRVEHVRGSAREACEEAIGLVFPQANARGLGISTTCVGDSDVSFLGDPHRVEQILVNLLSNAVKFTPTGGRVDVTCGHSSTPALARAVADAPGLWCYVRVSDTGIGIAADQLDTIFDPFTQASSAGGGHGRAAGGDGTAATRPSYSREHGGTGLGLTISRRLARLMGGDVTVESILGVGTSFTLWLPAPVEPVADTDSRLLAGRSPTERRTGTRDTPGIGAVGRVLRELSGPIIVEHVRRLRNGFAAPNVDRLRDIELEDHLDTLLTEFALALTVVEEAAGQASRQLRDGHAIQRVLAQRHGAQRASIGWGEQDIHREFTLLRSIIERTLRAQGASNPELDGVGIDAAFEVLARRLDHVERAASDGWRRRMNPGMPQS